MQLTERQLEKGYQAIAERATEGLPLSVGTALAISAIKENRSYGTLWINMRTLIRNMYQAVDKEKRDLLYPEVMIRSIIDEIKIIRDYLSHLKGVRIYWCDYDQLQREYPNALIRLPNTKLQKDQYLSMKNIGKELWLPDNPYHHNIIRVKGSNIEGEPEKSLIITNYPVDLLSRTRFKQLRLLESYTGAIKGRSEWNSKLTGGKTLTMMPFNKFTIQIFGDNGNQFNQYGRKVREPVIKLALDNRWTPVTTPDKIRWNIRKMPDQFSAKVLEKFL